MDGREEDPTQIQHFSLGSTSPGGGITRVKPEELVRTEGKSGPVIYLMVDDLEQTMEVCFPNPRCVKVSQLTMMTGRKLSRLEARRCLRFSQRVREHSCSILRILRVLLEVCTRWSNPWHKFRRPCSGLIDTVLLLLHLSLPVIITPFRRTPSLARNIRQISGLHLTSILPAYVGYHICPGFVCFPRPHQKTALPNIHRTDSARTRQRFESGLGQVSR